MENFDSLSKISDILKSSMKSVQKSSIHKGSKINNATGAYAKSKKVRDVSKGGGGGFQKNVHMTFLEDKIDL